MRLLALKPRRRCLFRGRRKAKTYLQREINRRLGKKGNTLYEIVQSTNSELAPPEADFVDTVNRNLERGKFLLLIVGDGIREGAIGITEFLSNVGHLNFAFAMIELSI